MSAERGVWFSLRAVGKLPDQPCVTGAKGAFAVGRLRAQGRQDGHAGVLNWRIMGKFVTRMSHARPLFPKPSPFYGLGLKMYDVLAGRAGLGRTEFLSRSETLAHLPMTRASGLKGGVKYWAGQFNDARMALARTVCGITKNLRLVGGDGGHFGVKPLHAPEGLHSHGGEQAQVRGLPGGDHWLCAGLSVGMVRFAVRHEYAIRVEDVLARRSRLLFLDAALARRVAGVVADILQEEMGRDPKQKEFERLGQHYLLNGEENI